MNMGNEPELAGGRKDSFRKISILQRTNIISFTIV